MTTEDLDQHITLLQGCRVYLQQWRYGYLWIAELFETNRMHLEATEHAVWLRLVDAQGFTVYQQMSTKEVWHVGQTHDTCVGTGVKDVHRATNRPEDSLDDSKNVWQPFEPPANR